MATSGPDLLVAAYRLLADEEQDEAFERIHELRVEKEAGADSDMSRYIRSLRRVAQEVGRTPTAEDYREVQPKLAQAGEPVESFGRVYRFFGSWPRAREALDLSQTTTPRRIEARFRERRLGKVWRYDPDDLRDALHRAAEHYGYPPSTNEFDWWRERELALAKAAGKDDAHLPSVTPYRKRWGSWEAALLHFGYSPEEVARRLTAKNNIITRTWNPDAQLPAGLPMADLSDSFSGALPLGTDDADRLRAAYAELPRRSRYVLTVRLGLLGTTQKLREAAHPLGLSLDRVRQLQVEALDLLAEAVIAGSSANPAKTRTDVEKTLHALAVANLT